MEWTVSDASCQSAVEVMSEYLRRAELQADQVVGHSHGRMERWLSRAVHIHEAQVSKTPPSYGACRARSRSMVVSTVDERRRIVDKQLGAEGKQDMEALRREEVALEERRRTLGEREASLVERELKLAEQLSEWSERRCEGERGDALDEHHAQPIRKRPCELEGLLVEETSETAVVRERHRAEMQRRESRERVLEGLRRKLEEKEAQCCHLQAQIDRMDEEISAARLESLERSKRIQKQCDDLMQRDSELGRLRKELEETQRSLREQQAKREAVACEGETTLVGLESVGGRIPEQCTGQEDHSSTEHTPAAYCEWEAEEKEGQLGGAEAGCTSEGCCVLPTSRRHRAPAAFSVTAMETSAAVPEHPDPPLSEGERSVAHYHSEWSHAESPDSSADDTAAKHVEQFAAGLSQSMDSYEYLEHDDSYLYTEEDVLRYDRIRVHMEQTHPRGRRRGFPDAFGGVHAYYEDIKQHQLEPLFDALGGDFPGKQAQMEVGAVVREACVVGTKQLHSYWIRRCRELFMMMGVDGDFSTYDDHVFNAWVCIVQERCYPKLLEPDSEMRSEFVSAMMKRVSERRGAWPMDVVLQLMDKLWSVVCYAECTAPICTLQVCEAGEMYDAEEYDVFSDNLYYYDDPDELECFGLLPRLVRASDGETEQRGVANIVPEQ